MIEPKFPSSGTNIFTVMSALANEHKAINLSQGFPDFPIDSKLGGLVADAIQQGFNQYAPMAGLPLLRERIAHKIHHFQKVTVDPETEITITPGATYGIYTALTTILQPGDEVIVLEPAYDSYIPNIYMAGAKPVPVALSPDDFSVDWEKIFAAANSRTKVIIINNPHNPCGSIWKEEDFRQLSLLVQQYQLFVIADEVYEHLVFDDQEHLSVIRFPELRERSFVIHSFGKAFHSTGWKMGYCIAPPALTAAFRQIHQFLAFSVNTPMQKGIADYLADPEQLKATTTLLQAKRDLFLNAMKSSRFTYTKPASGSYFQIMGYKDISALPDKDFAIWLTKEIGVATIPVSAFYHDKKDEQLIRFCFAKKEETLLSAIEKLINL